MITEEVELIERRVRTDAARLAEALEGRVRARILIACVTRWSARGTRYITQALQGSDHRREGLDGDLRRPYVSTDSITRSSQHALACNVR